MHKRAKFADIPYIQCVLGVIVAVLLVASPGCKLTQRQAQEEPPGTTYDPEGLFNTSGHADETSGAFRHWDEDDPPLVSAGCARCHSTDGFLDFIDDGVVSSAKEPGAFGCDLCHPDPDSGATRDLGTVTFPSGAVIGGLGTGGICMQCHQGRYSGPGVDAYIAGRGGGGEDVVNPSLSFRNIHYYPAGATLYGKYAKGGYQYAGKSYDGRLNHVEDYDSCAECHDPHSLEVKSEACAECHSQVTTAAGASVTGHGLHDIRWAGSLVDYDGDGNVTEGIHDEIVTFQERLHSAMWRYSKDVSGAAAAYESHTYPYFFYDSNENGMIDPEEASYGNRYRSWTPRLLKAAYNFQTSKKDPGGFAHGGKYHIQLLYDSLTDLNQSMPNPVSMAGMHRDDEGHFDGASEAWRHWDEDGEVPGRCSRCHSSDGIAQYLEHGENKDAHFVNGMHCTTCHTEDMPEVRQIPEVTFPSGAVVNLPDNSNLCIFCHQGRASKYSVDSAIAASPGPYRFINIHYYPVGAMFFGTEVKGGYEFAGKSYVGRQTFDYHEDQFDNCVECHMGVKGANSAVGHNVRTPNPADCVTCHGKDVSQPNPSWDAAYFTFQGIRPATVPDYDGDGNTGESLKAEIQGLEKTLYALMLAYGKSIGNPIVYDSHSYPYFFSDTNGNGVLDPPEASSRNRYNFDAKMLRAAYNYQASKKEPGGYAHNSRYVAQLLVDSIAHLGGNVAPYTWR